MHFILEWLTSCINDYLAELVSLEFEARFADGCPCVELGEVLSISTRSIKPKDHLGEVWEHYSIPAFDETHWPVFELADEIKSNKYIVDRNSILISKLNPSIKRIWIPVCVSNTAVCSTEFIVYKANNPKHKSFYNAAINAPAFTEFLLEHVTGSTGSRQRTQPKATLEYSIPNPPDTEIEAFCGYADPIYAQIKSNELESQALSSLRDLLLPKLMSGEIDISNIDITQLNNHLSFYRLKRALMRIPRDLTIASQVYRFACTNFGIQLVLPLGLIMRLLHAIKYLVAE